MFGLSNIDLSYLCLIVFILCSFLLIYILRSSPLIYILCPFLFARMFLQYCFVHFFDCLYVYYHIYLCFYHKKVGSQEKI